MRRRGTGHTRVVGVALAAGVLAGCSVPDRPAELSGGWVGESMVERVDPFIGTGGHGHVYPGATVPFGMVQVSPDNGRSGWDWTAGYHRSDSLIAGFSHTHLSGTGIGDLLDVLVMPVAGPVDIGYGGTGGDEAGRGASADDADAPDEPPTYRDHEWVSPFSARNEHAEPGYYSVRLERPGVRAEVTATPRVGLHRYTFPASDDAGLVVDLGYAQNWDRAVATRIRTVSDTLLTGARRSTGWARDQRIFFALALSKPAREVVRAEDGPRTRALLRFATTEGEAVLVKVGVSYVSEEGALRNLRTEAPGWSFEQARAGARRAWERELRKVRVAGGSEAQRTTFATALYRTRLCPVLFEDVDGRYRGGDGRVHHSAGYTRHSIFSLWDTFRAQHPLFTLIDPRRVPDLVASMLAFHDESGLLPVWELVANETNTMTGHHAVPVVAEAALKGLVGRPGGGSGGPRDDGSAGRAGQGRAAVDPGTAGVTAGALLDAALKSAAQDHRGLSHYRRYGYIPSELEVESVTKTLEYAYDDWAVARLAGALGRHDVAERFRERARRWRNVLDPDTRFMRGRRADGSWVEPFDPLHASHRENTDYTEGNAWQHTWFVPHDVAALIDLMGGDEAFAAKLDSLFEADTLVSGENVSPDISGMIGQYAHGNEPSHHIAYLYTWAGMPWKTQERVRQILATQYRAAPDGLAGNEDCGQMSAWYVLSALGFYPVDPVSGVYVLGSPLFPEAVMEVGGGRRFVVRAEGADRGRPYVVGARLNGVPLTRSWLEHDEVAAGGELVLEMAAEPDRAWGSSRGSRPPSMSDPAASDAASAPASSPDTIPRRPALSAPDLTPDTATARRVRQEFLHAWNGYVEHAWGHDALKPLSRTSRDWYDTSLLMTPVDAFDTMILMGLDQQAERAKELIFQRLDFDHDVPVQVFEVTIRLLGGLLSAYQMDGDERFLELATDLADRLMPAFDSPTGMPFVMVNLRTGETGGPVNNPAEIGTLTLEFGTLSRLTGDPTYYDAVKRGVEEVYRRRSDIGLVGTAIDVRTGEWTETDSHVSGRIDSYYEYLLKAWLLFGDDDFLRMWEASVGPVNRYLADDRFDGLWYGHADMHTGERTATRFGALDAFLPGLLALGGDLDRAARLQESVHRMWTTFDVEPEQMDYSTMEVVWAGYPLRPEAIESAYYLYRLTGDERWRDMGRDMFERIVRWARTDVAYAHLEDVRTKELADDMESFFLAETLKYAWLLFAPPETLDFDSVVFNTEAHPLKAVPTTSSPAGRGKGGRAPSP